MTWKRFYRPLCRLLTQSKWQISFCVRLAFVLKLVWMWMQQAEIASISNSYWSLNGIYVEQLFSEDFSTESRLKMSISYNTKNMQIKFQFIYFLLNGWHCLYSGMEHILKPSLNLFVVACCFSQLLKSVVHVLKNVSLIFY